MTKSLTLWRLSFWLGDLVPDFVDIEGRIFVDRHREGVQKIRLQTMAYETLKEAQQWLNIVLLDAFLDEAVGDAWEIHDPGLGEILEVYVKVWTCQLTAKFPDSGLSVEVLRHDDDVGVRLVQR